MTALCDINNMGTRKTNPETYSLKKFSSGAVNIMSGLQLLTSQVPTMAKLIDNQGLLIQVQNGHLINRFTH